MLAGPQPAVQQVRGVGRPRGQRHAPLRPGSGVRVAPAPAPANQLRGPGVKGRLQRARARAVARLQQVAVGDLLNTEPGYREAPQGEQFKHNLH